MATVEGESWDLASEYRAADCPEVDADFAEVDALLNEIERRNTALGGWLEADKASGLTAAGAADVLVEARTIFLRTEQAARLVHDLHAYAECSLSVDSQHAEAQHLQGRLQAVQKRLTNAEEPLRQFLALVPDEVVDAYLAHADAAPSRFAVLHERQRSDALLPLAHEALENNLSQDGLHAWGRLYDQLAGTLACKVPTQDGVQTMGLAQASGMMQDANQQHREGAWRAINGAWEEHVESCAAAINAIAGWRLEMCRQRSKPGRPVHFLDDALHQNRITKPTLETVLQVAQEGAPLARRAARLQAKAYGASYRYGPWDQRAPAPAAADAADVESEPLPYAQAVALIAESYGAVDPRMGDFVHMMAKKGWVEGTVGPRKRPGAYCTGFLKSRTPRVYMTYTGRPNDVIVLAHELGHAFHSWVMRDLPLSQRGYGMAIAETASTFGESVVRDALLERAKTPAARLEIVWEEAAALVGFVLNIPVRFEFERNFYEARAERPLRAAELKELMSAAWRNWYGDCLAEPDPLFWANKLHFYISGLSFYNFPYLFGYLFSLGVYARRKTFGEEFFARYEALLLDTGRMTAEELAAKHLDVDLTQPDFWRDTLALLETRIDVFEELVEG